VKRILLLLVAALGAMPGVGEGQERAQRREPNRDAAVVFAWMQAVKAHRPGVVDAPLRYLALASARDNSVVIRRVRGLLVVECSDRGERNDVLHRAVLAHTDVALLLPEEAAKFEWGPQFASDRSADPGPNEPAGVIYAIDGEFRATGAITGHWRMARWLARQILPRPSNDEFVREWYRAIAALHLRDYQFGFAKPHLEEAQRILPDDGMVEFYTGLLHEGSASARVQNIPITQPALAARLHYPSPQAEWRQAERWLRRAVEREAPLEARLHLGRVLGRLDRHQEAATVLKDALPLLQDARLEYLCHLFLGTEEAALGQFDAAQASFERAAALYPTAQSPLLSWADAARRTGRRTEALEVLRRIQRLPVRLADRVDPWQGYLRESATDAGARLAAVRAMVSRSEVSWP
jgi:tetratricopeptide (TPR) repeat protein